MIHLHTHSQYSPMDGLIPLERLVELAKGQGSPCLAITETMGVYSMMNFIELCRDSMICPIIGFYLNKNADAVILARGEKRYLICIN